MAGLSTQQIRNYADAGILPAVPRTATGHRRFGDAHRLALLAYRALARGCGPVDARAIMRTLHAGDLPGALARLDAAHASLHEQRLSAQATKDALEAVAQRSPDTPALPRRDVRIGEVAAHLGVRTSALRTWESAGLLTPGREPGTGYRRFTPSDVRDAQMISLLRRAHYPLPQIRPILDGLRRSGGSDALRAAIAGRNARLTRQAAAMLEAAGHLHHYITIESPAQTGSADSRPSAGD
jgi:DNA-binding transcriptional MerR regulator